MNGRVTWDLGPASSPLVSMTDYDHLSPVPVVNSSGRIIKQTSNIKSAKVLQGFQELHAIKENFGLSLAKKPLAPDLFLTLNKVLTLGKISRGGFQQVRHCLYRLSTP